MSNYVKMQISPMYLYKAQNPTTCHNYARPVSALSIYFGLGLACQDQRPFSPKPRNRFQNNFTEMFPEWSSTKIAIFFLHSLHSPDPLH